jgi:nucleotide-binding universal stress UspA family protein
MAVCGKSKITLVRVIHSHTLDEDRALKAQADHCMKERLAQFSEASIPAEKLLLSGEPEKELEKEIKTGKYDLVALATHGHKAFSDILLGSVSDYLKHAVDIPLLMVSGKQS